MNAKWQEWLRSRHGRPVPRLTFQYWTGGGGSLADFSGNLLLVLFSRKCSTCRDVLSKLMPIVENLSVTLLILGDQTMEDAREFSAGDIIPKTAKILTGSASFPEIHLGFNIPRGAWLRYPTLFLLDREGRVRVATDVPEQMTDCGWLRDRMTECTTVPT
jgi:hypothetical protein